MAVTAVTITSGPIIVGRSVTISGTLTQDGSGVNNLLNFLVYDIGYVSVFTISRLSDNSSVYNAAGTAGSGIAWTWTGTLPDGNYLAISVSLADSPYTGLATSSAIGPINLNNKGLSNIWIPRRDARGLFVQRKPVYPAWGSSRVFNKLRHVIYPTLKGVYSNLADSQWSLTNDYAFGIQTPYGMGLDVPSGWYWNDGKALPINGGPVTSTFVSVFSLYAASNAVSASKFASLFTLSTNSKYNDSGTYAWWKNTAGEQAILVNPSISGGGAEFSITGVGNGLHCFVMQVSVGGGATGVRSFLDGQLVATTQAPTYAPQSSPLPNYYWGSIAQRDLNVGNLHLYGELFDDAMTDSALAALSLDPYRYFFVDAPSQKSRLSRLISIPNNLTLYRSLILDNGRITQLPTGQQNTGKAPLALQSGVIKQSPVVTSLIPGRFLPQRWRQQPSYPAPIDESSSFANEIVHAGTPYNLGQNASSRYPVLFNGNTNSLTSAPIVSGRGGLAWKSVQYFEWLATKHPWQFDQSSIQWPQTLMVVMSAECDTFSGTALYSGTAWGMGGGDRLSVNASGQLNYFQNYVEVLVAPTPIPTRAVNVLMLTSAPVIGTRLFINGRLAASDATYRPGYAGTYAPPERIGFTQNAGIYPWHTFASIAWKRALSDADAAALGENPWQLFKPKQSKFFSIPTPIATTTTTLAVGKFQPQRWRKQPQRPVEIDWSNPITKSLIVCVSPSNPLREITQSRLLTTGNERNFNATPNGLAFGRFNQFSTFGDSPGVEFDIVSPSGGMTAAIVSGGIAQTLGDTGWLANIECQRYDVANDTQEYVEFSIRVWDANSVYMQLSNGIFDGSVYSSTMPILTSQLRGQNVIFGYIPEISVGPFKHSIGSAEKTIQAFPNGDSLYTPTASLFRFTGSLLNLQSIMTMALWWKRELSAAERGSMQDNPWQIFRPEQSKFFSLPGTAAGTSAKIILKDNRIQTLNPTTDGLIT